MAISESIRNALDAVFIASTEIENLLKAFESLEREDLKDSPMVYVFRTQFDRFSDSCKALETILIQQALPVLEDFESVSKAN